MPVVRRPFFYGWRQHIDSRIELRPIELAGRGRRFLEPIYKDRTECVEDVYNQIKNEISQSPYMIFGHSLGSLIAYELVHRIKNSGLPAPRHLFFSGSSAPTPQKKRQKISLVER